MQLHTCPLSILGTLGTIRAHACLVKSPHSSTSSKPPCFTNSPDAPSNHSKAIDDAIQGHLLASSALQSRRFTSPPTVVDVDLR
ncbi:hypothetical protein JAAARDRAFT_496182 [Jaapia argillacea MUCL 33604]|uniref:Uncharacterized protein n=1 Tax=Jaapia argillacea MUCL 33604 TaxID=933084 RepID=A0A067PLK8_9AGAM|nr:hypothetical protein JAAARDRAFT_496182 [Jaapia argillacea MUCL 33604]